MSDQPDSARKWLWEWAVQLTFGAELMPYTAAAGLLRLALSEVQDMTDDWERTHLVRPVWSEP